MSSASPRAQSRLAIVVLAAASIALPRLASAGAPEAPLPVESYALPNGLRVALAPDPSLRDVGVVMQCGAGAADDPPGKEGLAHLVEHLTYERSSHVGVSDASEWGAGGGIRGAREDAARIDRLRGRGAAGGPPHRFVAGEPPPHLGQEPA